MSEKLYKCTTPNCQRNDGTELVPFDLEELNGVVSCGECHQPATELGQASFTPPTAEVNRVVIDAPAEAVTTPLAAVPQISAELVVQDPGVDLKLEILQPALDIIRHNGVTRDRGIKIISELQRPFIRVDEIKTALESLPEMGVIGDVLTEEQADTVDAAYKHYRELVGIRNDIDRQRLAVNRPALNETNATNAIAKKLTEQVVAVEKDAKKVADIKKELEARKEAELLQKRRTQIAAFGTVITDREVLNMSQETWDSFAEGQKQVFEAKEAAALEENKETARRTDLTNNLSAMGFTFMGDGRYRLGEVVVDADDDYFSKHEATAGQRKAFLQQHAYAEARKQSLAARAHSLASIGVVYNPESQKWEHEASVSLTEDEIVDMEPTKFGDLLGEAERHIKTFRDKKAEEARALVLDVPTPLSSVIDDVLASGVGSGGGSLAPQVPPGDEAVLAEYFNSINEAVFNPLVGCVSEEGKRIFGTVQARIGKVVADSLAEATAQLRK